MTQAPEPQQGRTSARWWGVAAAGVLVLVLVLVLAVWRGSDEADGPEDGSTSVPANGGPGSPTITPSPGQTEPGVAETPTTKPGVVRAEIGEAAPIKAGPTVQVVRSEAVKGKAQGPGEVAGPAVRITIELVNDTSSAMDLSAVTVTAYVGPRRKPAGELSGPGAKAFPASVEPGGTATGVFVFRMSPGQRGDVRVDVSYRGESPTVVFTGSVR